MTKGTSQKRKKQLNATQNVLDVDTEMVTQTAVEVSKTKKPGKWQTAIPGTSTLAYHQLTP